MEVLGRLSRQYSCYPALFACQLAKAMGTPFVLTIQKTSGTKRLS